MLVQHRAEALRLITQHDHALVSGALARAWSGPDAREGDAAGELLSLEVILAAALHDVSWRELDRTPRWDPDRNLPHDFTTYPRELRRAATAAGIAEVRALHPYAGRLVTLHYERLGIETPPEPSSPSPRWAPEDTSVRRDVQLLRLFDNLSLRLCLTPPGSGPEGHYPWLLAPDRLALPGSAAPSEADAPPRASARLLDARWTNEETLSLEPWPFRLSPLDLEVPYREIPRSALLHEGAFQAAWREAPVARQRCRLVEGATTLRGS